MTSDPAAASPRTIWTVIVESVMDEPSTFQPRCMCRWRGTKRQDDEAAKDEAMCHSIESGHRPAWIETWNG